MQACTLCTTHTRVCVRACVTPGYYMVLRVLHGARRQYTQDGLAPPPRIALPALGPRVRVTVRRTCARLTCWSFGILWHAVPTCVRRGYCKVLRLLCVTTGAPMRVCSLARGAALHVCSDSHVDICRYIDTACMHAYKQNSSAGCCISLQHAALLHHAVLGLQHIIYSPCTVYV